MRIIHKNNSTKELKKYITEWLSSINSTDRLLAVSLLMWFGNDFAIEKLKYISNNDDSEYVRFFASWAGEVSLQEKYSKIIYEDVLKEDNLQIISTKLHQIKPVITPMTNYWVVKLNDKYKIYSDDTEKYKRMHISRFWNRISENIKDDKKFKINNRKLFEYYRGEKITDNNRFITGEIK